MASTNKCLMHFIVKCQGQASYFSNLMLQFAPIARNVFWPFPGDSNSGIGLTKQAQSIVAWYADHEHLYSHLYYLTNFSRILFLMISFYFANFFNPLTKYSHYQRYGWLYLLKYFPLFNPTADWFWSIYCHLETTSCSHPHDQAHVECLPINLNYTSLWKAINQAML